MVLSFMESEGSGNLREVLWFETARLKREEVLPGSATAEDATVLLLELISRQWKKSCSSVVALHS